MSHDPDSNSGLRTPLDPYETGYGRPPKETRFQPGQSGNPRGRPKGARRRSREKEFRLIDELILKEARRTIQIKEGDKTRKMSIVEAAMRSLSVAALKGNHRAQRLLLEHVRRAEDEEQHNKLENFKKLYDYKQRWENEIEHCKKHGLPIPDIIPHPNQIIIDPRSGTAKIVGPLTKEEKVQWDRIHAAEEGWRKALPQLEADLKAEEDPEMRKFLEKEISEAKSMLRILARFVRDSS